MNRTALVLLALSSAAVVGCFAYFLRSSDETNNDDRERLFEEQITIGASEFPGYTALYVADGKGFFQDEGLDVVIQHYPGTVELSRAYVAGHMQGRANLTLEAIQEHLTGMHHRVVLAIDYSSGSDAIVAGGEIANIADLKHKKIAFEKDGLGEFFVRWALDEYGLSLADIEPVYCDPQEAGTLLEKQQADAAVTYEPTLSRLTTTGQYRVIYSSADAPGLITDILTFRSDFVEAYPDTVRAILRAYFRGHRYWKEQPVDANTIVGNVLGASAASIAEQQKGVHILDLRDNRIAFSFASGFQSLYGNMRRIHEFVRETRGGDSPLELTGTDELIEPRFVRELSREIPQ